MEWLWNILSMEWLWNILTLMGLIPWLYWIFVTPKGRFLLFLFKFRFFHKKMKKRSKSSFGLIETVNKLFNAMPSGKGTYDDSEELATCLRDLFCCANRNWVVKDDDEYRKNMLMIKNKLCALIKIDKGASNLY